LLSVVNDFSSYFYVYDSSDRVTTQIMSNAGGPVTVLTTDYGERWDDRPVSRSATVDGVPDFVNLYEYDDQDRLVALSQTGQGGSAVADKLVTFDYNDNGQFLTITRYASLDGSQVIAVSDYTYDQYGRPTALVHHQDPAAPLAEYTWAWEGGGDTVEVVPVGTASGPQFGSGRMLSVGGPFAPTVAREVEINTLPNYVWTFDTAFIGHLVQTTSTDGTVDYQYDPRGQLLSADYTAGAGLLTSAGAGLPTAPSDEFYTYDSNGNRTNPGYVTGDYNRLLSDGTYDYDYDAEGNRTRRTDIATGEVTEYHWDHRNRLVRISTRTTDNGPLTTDTSYAYDYLNRWIARSHDPDGDGPLDFTNTYFVYDGTPPSGSLLDRAAVTMENIGQIVLHFDSDGQGDPQLAHRYLWGPAVDQILADEQVTDPTAPDNIVWPLTDHLNTVRDMAMYDADTDTTTIVNHLIYDAYGRITSQSDPDHTTLFAFAARPFDPATGLQNNLNRWYDAEAGRWISEDPIGFEATDANLYRYVGNSPIAHVDPSGLAQEQREVTVTMYYYFEELRLTPGIRREVDRILQDAMRAYGDPDARLRIQWEAVSTREELNAVRKGYTRKGFIPLFRTITGANVTLHDRMSFSRGAGQGANFGGGLNVREIPREDKAIAAVIVHEVFFHGIGRKPGIPRHYHERGYIDANKGGQIGADLSREGAELIFGRLGISR
jgi:RHS repeat-associated protein